MPEPQEVNDQRKELDKNDYSHLMLAGAYHIAMGQNARDGDNNNIYWDAHPTHNSAPMRINLSKSETVSTPANSYMDRFASDDQWQQTGSISFDGLFVPYSTNFAYQSDYGKSEATNRAIGMPSFERPYSKQKGKRQTAELTDIIPWTEVADAKDSDGKHIDKLRASAPAPGVITSASLNPLASGHSIQLVNKNREITNPSIEGGGYASHSPTMLKVPEEGRETARPLGLRGPMVMAGWGYDIYGMPAPNLRFDSENRYHDPTDTQNYGRQRYVSPAMKAKTLSGVQNDVKHFVPNHMKRPDTWKVGPVDLRWDHQRKVWVGGKHNGVYLSKAAKCLLPKAGIDGNNSFNFGVGGNITAPGRLYRNPCPTHDCNFRSYFPTSIHYPDIEIYDPEDHNWCGRCMTLGNLTACADFKDACAPFYDAIIIRPVDEMVGPPNQLSECTDKFMKVQGGAPGMRRAGNPCHGWGSSYLGKLENVNKKIGEDETWTHHAKAMLYERIFIENPLGQGLMVGDAFFSYDTGKRIVYEYERTDIPSCGDAVGKRIKVKETIPVHVILQAEFFGIETITHAGCDRGEMAACSKKFFAQGFVTAEDCGPDDDYPETAGG